MAWIFEARRVRTVHRLSRIEGEAGEMLVLSFSWRTSRTGISIGDWLV